MTERLDRRWPEPLRSTEFFSTDWVGSATMRMDWQPFGPHGRFVGLVPSLS